jgi:hypothetical protein
MSGITLLSAYFLWSLMIPISHGAADGTSKPSLDKAFPLSAKCKRCHERVYEEWEASPLSRSIHSAAFRATLNEYLLFSGGKNKALCFSCHAPHINEFPDLADTFVAQARSGDPGIDGVGCAQCHLIQHVDRTKQPPVPKYVTGKTLFGPYKDFVQNLAHQSVDLDLFRKTDLCLNCHLAVPAAANLGNANDLLGPWAASASVKSGKQCQTCHMPAQVGESANGEKKRTIANHSFPGRLGKLRQDAAKIDFRTEVKGQQTTVTVTLRNLVPHNLPTTHPGWASVLLDLTIKGKNLKIVFHEQRVYGRTYADAKGEPTVFDFKAVTVLKDTVLKPEETRIETFAFPTPTDTRSFDVEVSMHYAPVTGPPAFLQRIEAESVKGAQDPAFEPIPIASKSENIPLR